MGMHPNRVYRIYHQMKDRCTNENHKDYHKYKHRPICTEWLLGFEVFERWALNNGYSDELSIDRKDNSKGYSPENCRWATRTAQQRNRDKQSNNTSGYMGVYFKKNRTKPWYTQLNVDGKTISLTGFESARDAAVARDKYIIEHKLFDYPLQVLQQKPE